MTRRFSVWSRNITGSMAWGMLGLNKAFRIQSGPEGIGFIPIYNTDKVMLRDLVGYESQKAQLRHNTEAIPGGRSANNACSMGRRHRQVLSVKV